MNGECGKSERIVRNILKEWLKGRGKPVTWQTLIDTPRDCKHTNLDSGQYSTCVAVSVSVTYFVPLFKYIVV